jgi:hypothetical protein
VLPSAPTLLGNYIRHNSTNVSSLVASTPVFLMVSMIGPISYVRHHQAVPHPSSLPLLSPSTAAAP